MTANDTPTPPPSTTPAPANAPTAPGSSRGRARPGSGPASWSSAPCWLGSAYVRLGPGRADQGGPDPGPAGPRLRPVQGAAASSAPGRGSDTKLDPLIARGTGADQIVTRRYVNQDTGVDIDVILLYGPAVEMYIHAPEVCYPAAGYAQVAGPDVREIESGGRTGPVQGAGLLEGRGGPTSSRRCITPGGTRPLVARHRQTEELRADPQHVQGPPGPAASPRARGATSATPASRSSASFCPRWSRRIAADPEPAARSRGPTAIPPTGGKQDP